MKPAIEDSVQSWALVASMGALGNVLGMISIGLLQVPTAGLSQVAFDFSNVAVVIMAVFLGWRLGALTGLIAGLGPAVMFGFVVGQTGFVTFLIPVGKAMTGLFVGLISQRISAGRVPRSPLVFGAVVLGFIPEALLILLYFRSIIPLFFPTFGWATALALPVFVKAWAEMVIISFLTIALIGNAGFVSFLTRFVPSTRLLVTAKQRR